ncbi:Undefined function [Listeria monocytogenes]|nr:Undefined function [Listeria monocytogenes]
MGLLKALKDVKDHKKVNANDEDYKYIDMWKRTKAITLNGIISIKWQSG